ncbi:MAG: M23 family metallopeptidase [Bacteroidales bacterium]|nr:M23 family metallopeptidase [Bacteroidales bacterium]
MAKKEKKTNAKTKKRYRLVILDEISLKERFNFTMTKGNLFTYVGSLIILIGFLVVLLFIFTPLKYFLPPVDNYKLEKSIIQNTILIDSLEKEILLRDGYYAQISSIIKGEDIQSYGYSDSSNVNSLLTQEQKDSILNELLDRDEQSLNQIRENDLNGVEKSNFQIPVSGGVVSNEFNAAKNHYGIDLVAQQNEPVLATLAGTVVLATWSLNSGYIIQIQHSNNLISVYKHNGELLKKEGDRVIAGEPVALVGNTGENSTGPHLHFEIWQDGVPINPANFINF